MIIVWRRIVGLIVMALSALLAAMPAMALPGLSPTDLNVLNRVSDPQASPDGRTLVFVQRETDMAANKGRTDLFVLDLGARTASPRRLAADPANDSQPQWSADGRWVYFLSGRSGSAQVWRVGADGQGLTQVTDLPLALGGFHLSPAGDRLAFWADAFPDCGADLACTKARLDARAAAKTSGHAHDQLFVRHWDSWADGTRSRLFTAALGADGKVTGAVADIAGKLVGDTPSKPHGGAEEISFSPDGRTLYFALREAGRIEALSTNLDIFAAPADGSAPAVNLTDANDATDSLPRVSPDGRTLAWVAMARPGFEADRLVLMLRDLKSGRTRALTKGWDRSVNSFEWAADGKSLLATTNDEGNVPLVRVEAATGRVAVLVSGGSIDDFTEAGKRVVYVRHGLDAPADLHVLEGGRTRPLTAVNAALLAGRALGRAETFTFKGWNDELVHAFLVKPAGFEAGKRYPLAFVVHGGPQSTLSNQWHYRWNAQVLAGAGYAVLFVDFHGSVGYGQAFTDSITQDWGGKPLEDLRKGLAAALARHDWIDGDRACALGGSYGGYMMNWIAGQWPDGFRCLVNHAGILDARHMAYATEELWFNEWEHGGAYYEVPANYEKHNPVHFVDRWKTPTLVIHGQQDFRVPFEEGIATFTALQRRDIPSRLLVYPDENHWILKPANSIQWYEEVLAWLNRWTR